MNSDYFVLRQSDPKGKKTKRLPNESSSHSCFTLQWSKADTQAKEHLCQPALCTSDWDNTLFCHRFTSKQNILPWNLALYNIKKEIQTHDREKQ